MDELPSFQGALEGDRLSPVKELLERARALDPLRRLLGSPHAADAFEVVDEALASGAGGAAKEGRRPCLRRTMLKMESVLEARPFTAPWYVMPKKPAAVPMLPGRGEANEPREETAQGVRGGEGG